MQELLQRIAELEAITRTYTVFFQVFDIFFVLLAVLCIVLGIKSAKSRRNLKESNEYLIYTIRGQEEERGRISRELHDTVAQDLRYCKMLCEQKDAASRLAEISVLLKKSIQQVRDVSYDLAPPDITKNNFIENLKDLCMTYTESSKVLFRVSVLDGTDTSFLTAEEVLNLYRISQEAINNSLKHSKSSEIVVMLRNETESEEKGLYLFISDEGVGFDAEKEFPRSAKHFGLKGMQKRAQLIGARLQIISAKDEGTQVSVFMPNTTQTTIQKWGGVKHGHVFRG